MHVLAVTNMYPTAEAPASGTFVEQQVIGVRAAGVDVSVLLVDRRRRGPHAYFGTARELSRALRRCEPDLVHVMYGGILADQVTRQVSEAPVVVSFCGTDLLGQPLCGPVRKFMSAYGVVASHRAARRASGIIVKSKNLLDALPPATDRSKVRVIPNGVDLERFGPRDRESCRRQLGWNLHSFHVLFPTNTGDPVKRFGLAASAVERLRRVGVPVEMHQLRGVPHAEVPTWLNASDVLLLTSAQEGSPNVVKEALACGIPVVAVDVGDVRERIQNVPGCYVASPEAADLADRLQAVFAGPRRTGTSARIHELSLQAMSARLKAFYIEIAAARTFSRQRQARRVVV